MDIMIKPPTLDISAYYLYDPVLRRQDSLNYEDASKMLWQWSNETYNYDYVLEYGTCQATGVCFHTPNPSYMSKAHFTLQRYQWGFSFIQLFIMNILVLLWALGIFFMWAIARLRMHQQGHTSIAGEHKATLELAASMLEGLPTSPDSTDPLFLSETDLLAHVQSIHGGSVAYTSSLVLKVPISFRHEIKVWARREAKWLCGLALFLVLATFLWQFNIMFEVWLIGPICGLSFSLAFGSTWRSRFLFTMVFTVLSTIPVIILKSY